MPPPMMEAEPFITVNPLARIVLVEDGKVKMPLPRPFPSIVVTAAPPALVMTSALSIDMPAS